VLATLVAATLLLAHSAAGWKHVTVVRQQGPLTATLSFESRPAFESLDDEDIRNVRLRLVLHRRVAFDHALAARGANEDPTLQLADVWGNGDPEALVGLQVCGNRCGHTLDLVIATTGRVVTQNIWPGWTVHGRELFAEDGRFFCTFAACAATTMPVQVLRLDEAGRHLVDVTRRHPDLIRRDSIYQWQTYLDERKYPYGHQWYGALVPYCADEYRLGVTKYCDRVLPARIKRQLTAWGYRNPRT
jgi:hypothetical protein